MGGKYGLREPAGSTVLSLIEVTRALGHAGVPSPRATARC